MADFTDDVSITFLPSQTTAADEIGAVVLAMTNVNNIGGTAIVYVNLVWDTVAAAHVRWTSSGAPDLVGASYPGPGTFGVNTSNFCIEAVRPP